MSYDLVIKRGCLVTADGAVEADLAIKGETIAAWGVGLHGAREIDAHGYYVLPGAVDGHVHLTDHSYWPYQPTADDFEAGTRAAAYGGVTTLIDFANPAPGEALLDGLDRRLGEAAGRATIDFGLHLNLRDPDPARLLELPAIVKRGIASFKLNMVYPGYRLLDAPLFRALEAIASVGGLAMVHAENADVMQELRERLIRQGRTGPEWHVAACPGVTEGEAIHRALALAHLAGAMLLIFHLSCREGVRELRLAKARGQCAAGETCSHYLVLTEEAYRGERARAQALAVNPPVRGPDHQAALWAGLADSTIDIISSDHEPALRPPGAADQPPGTTGVETRLALVHTFGVLRGRMTLAQWIRACCTHPARLFGLGRKGQLRPGCDADIVLFDPQRQVRLSPQVLHSTVDYATDDGCVVTGFPVTTVSRGEVIVRDGQWLGRPGRGRFVERGGVCD